MPSTITRLPKAGRIIKINRSVSSARVASAPRNNIGALMFSGKGLLAYYKADAANVTIVANKVSQWRDISGNNLHADQSSSARRPDFTSSWVNGNSSITFSGGQVLTSVGNIQNKSNPFTIGLVFQRTSTTGCSMVSPSTGGGLSLTANLNGNGKREIRANGVGFIENGNATLNPELWIVTTAMTPGNPGTTDYSLFTGVNITPTTVLNMGAGAIPTSGNLSVIGSLTNTGGNGLIGEIGELFCIDRILTSAEMLAYGNYVKNKYGNI
jgi:hypothetical protein